jgi:large conductance mechanosensitive channel
VLREAVGDQPEVVLAYGAFIQAIIDFLIIAFCIFLAVKAINKLSRKKEEAPEEPAAPAGPTQEELLTQIRDLLEKKN